MLRQAAIGMALLAVMASAVDGRADGPVCDLVVIDSSPRLDPPFARAVETLRDVVAHELTGPECSPVRLHVEASPEGVVVRAESRDGLETTRVVRDPRSLVPIVLGLLAAAPPEPTPRPTPDRPPARNPAQAAITPDADPHDLPDFPPATRPRSNAPAAVGVAIGLSTGIRAGVPTDVAMLDSELRADVLIHEWLLLALMRYAPLAAVSGIALDPDAYEEIGVGFGVGRELRWKKHTLDLTVSPSVVFVTIETDSPKEVEGELAQLRFNLGARYGYAVGAGWRFTLTLDTDVAPSSLIKARYPAPGLPPVPAWTTGFRLGAASNLL
jgi:hypothetical protein